MISLPSPSDRYDPRNEAEARRSIEQALATLAAAQPDETGPSVGGSGTIGKIPIWTGPATLGDSVIDVENIAYVSDLFTQAMADARYALIDHSHTTADITDFESAGNALWIGVGNFNTLGDARYLQLTGGTLTGALFGTTADFSDEVDALDFVLVGGSSGGGASAALFSVSDEGSLLASSVASMNFTGAGVTASAVDGAVTVNITGAVSSVFGRTGSVVAVAGDYSAADILDLHTAGDVWWLSLSGGTLTGALHGTTADFTGDVDAADFVLVGGEAGGGASSALFSVSDEGVLKASAVSSINFTGAGVTASAVGDAVTVAITFDQDAADARYVQLANLDTLGDARWLSLSGGTMTGSLVLSGSRPIVINPNGTIFIRGGAGGWADGYFFAGSGATSLGGYGALGSDDTLTHFYIGIHGGVKAMTLTPAGSMTVVEEVNAEDFVLVGGSSGGGASAALFSVSDEGTLLASSVSSINFVGAGIQATAVGGAVTVTSLFDQSAADARYSQLGHTHTFASLTSKPTTIGGYGITDFNSVGDARWLRLTGGTMVGNLFWTNGTGIVASTGAITSRGTAAAFMWFARDDDANTGARAMWYTTAGLARLWTGTGGDVLQVGLTTGNINMVRGALTLNAGVGFTVVSGAVTLPAHSVADAALSTNVPLLNATQTFTGVSVFERTAGSNALLVRTTGDANYRWWIDSSGVQHFGSGAVSADVNLYRSAANTLKTDDNFIVALGLTAANLALNGAANTLININSASAASYFQFNHQVAGSDRWHIGIRPNSDDFAWYSVGLAAEAMYIEYSTGSVVISNTATAADFILS